MKKIIILSGGMDSTTLLYKIVKEYGNENVVALTFTYGSKHSKEEIDCAAWNTNKLKVEHQIVDLTPVFNNFNSSLLDHPDSDDIPEGHYEEKNMKSTVVPFRNGILLSIAAGFAESLHADVIFYGAHGGDHAIYPDCTKEFEKEMSEAIKQGTYGKIKVVAPFNSTDKTGIVKEGIKLGVPYEHTWTCYNPRGNKPCEKCGSCVERAEAFELNNLTDPLLTK